MSCGHHQAFEGKSVSDEEFLDISGVCGKILIVGFCKKPEFNRRVEVFEI